MDARAVFDGSDGEVTRAYYAALARRGPAGEVAVNLFRAQKCSTRAKLYRGGIRGVGSFRRIAYGTKALAMSNLCELLPACAIPFGWKQDPECVFGEKASWVLYIDLPQGQASFHSPERLSAHDYPGEWDGEWKSEERILAFCDEVFRGPARPAQMLLSFAQT